MALVTSGWEGSCSLADTSGSISTLSYTLRAADHAAAQLAMGLVAAALADVTDSVIVKMTISEILEEDALVLPANAENAVKASCSVYLAGLGQRRANFKIPAPSVDIFVGATGPDFNTVDGSDAAVVAYVDLFKSTGVATISDGEDVRTASPWAGGKRISAASQNP